MFPVLRLSTSDDNYGGGQDWEQGYAVSRLADSLFVEACVTLGRYRHADSTDSREVTLAG